MRGARIVERNAGQAQDGDGGKSKNDRDIAALDRPGTLAINLSTRTPHAVYLQRVNSFMNNSNEFVRMTALNEVTDSHEKVAAVAASAS